MTVPQPTASVAASPAARRALITGITGQDGSYLAEHLLALGYEVHGLVRRLALEKQSQRLSRLTHLLPSLQLHAGEIENFASVFRLVEQVQPTELYHLAAQSYVATSFEDPFGTLQTNVTGTLNVLEAVRLAARNCRVYFAGSSEMFGNAPTSPQNEQTPLAPRSPYGVSKVAGFHLACNYREAHQVFAASGMLFNHESPRRGFEFVTRKISWHVAQIARGRLTQLPLGNLSAQRDWGFAGDYVAAMHLMLQQPTPQDFVVATGTAHSVADFCAAAFEHVNLDWRKFVVTRDDLQRPAEVHALLGDASRARTVLGWQPRTSFEELVRMMVDADLAAVDQG